MYAFADSIIFLSFTSLAILVPVFVFAVSLLGRAIEKASEERKKREEELQGKIEAASKKIEEASKALKQEGAKSLKKEIKNYEKEKRKHEKELGSIKRMPHYLTVNGCILWPGFYFLLSFVINNFAKQMIDPHIMNWLPLLFYIVAMGMLLRGFFIMYQCLNTIQYISLVSEQAQFLKTVSAFRKALEEFDETKRPKLKFIFKEAEPPFIFQANSEQIIKWGLYLDSGEVARDVQVGLLVPEEFVLFESDTYMQSGGKFSGYKITFFSLNNIKQGIRTGRSTRLKMPSRTGKYILCFYTCCEGFVSEDTEFIVEVI